MVGDSAKDDVRFDCTLCQHLHLCLLHPLALTATAVLQVVAGNRAGMSTILIDTLGCYSDTSTLQGELKPSYIVTSLAEIPELLQAHYDLQRPAAAAFSEAEAHKHP